MNLKNYTSTVSIEKSISTIEKCLIDAGAFNINKTIDPATKEITGINFQIMYNGIPFVFKLPSKVAQCFKRMWKNVSPRSAHRNSVRQNVFEQAKRTAWKLLSDSIAIQVSLIQIEQIELLEAFLPYTYDVVNDKTFFEIARDSGFKQLTMGDK